MNLTYIVNSEASAKELVLRLLDADEDFVYENVELYAGDESVDDFNELIKNGEWLTSLMILEQVELIDVSYSNGMLIVSVDWLNAEPKDISWVDG